jgi:hypothetical protein
MPIDEYEEEDKPEGEDLGRARRFTDFDCPDCNANNPCDDAFGDGEEIRCYYCGQEFRVDVTDSGRLRLKAI